MVLIPLRKQSEPPRASAFGPSDSRKPQFGAGSSARHGILGRVARDDSGVATIEYALLASLIAIGIVTGVENLGGKVGQAWDDIAQAVGGSSGSGSANTGGTGDAGGAGETGGTGEAGGNGEAGGTGNGGGNGNGNAGGNGNGNGNAGGNGNGNAGGNGNGNAGGNGNGNGGGNGNGNGGA